MEQFSPEQMSYIPCLTWLHTELPDNRIPDDVGVLIGKEALLIIRAVHAIVPGLREQCRDKCVFEVSPVGRVAASLRERDNRTVQGHVHVCLVTVL